MSDLAVWGIEPYVELSPRWIRARVGDTVVAASRRALLLAWYGPGMLPTYCLPPDDVRTDLLRPSRPGRGGPDHAVAHDVVAPDRVVERGAVLFRDPPAPLQAVDGHWTFTWDAGVSWFEEALEAHVHARDPRKRVDAMPSDRHVRVELDGEVLAESGRTHALFETNLPARWYFPPEDVRQDLLVPSGTSSRCPYKGAARYWSVQVGDTLHRDIAWSYPEPVIECPRIAGLISFFNERVDLVIDGVRAVCPPTPWST